MKVYQNKIEAIIGLHERGFIEDFELFGNDLLWVQKKIFLRPSDYKITEVYRFPELSADDKVIFGVISNKYYAKGILLNHYKIYTTDIPKIIKHKLIQLNYNNQQYSCIDAVSVVSNSIFKN
jgi:hypothetical protein